MKVMYAVGVGHRADLLPTDRRQGQFIADEVGHRTNSLQSIWGTGPIECSQHGKLGLLHPSFPM